MSGKTIGEECCGHSGHVSLTTLRCVCGCGTCFCNVCYERHCREIVERIFAPRNPNEEDDPSPFIDGKDPDGWRVDPVPIGDMLTTPPSWRIFVGVLRGPRGQVSGLRPGPGFAMTPKIAGDLGRRLIALEECCRQPPTLPIEGDTN